MRDTVSKGRRRRVYPYRFFLTEQGAQNSRLHICCNAPVQSIDLPLDTGDIDSIFDGSHSIDLRDTGDKNQLIDWFIDSGMSLAPDAEAGLLVSLLTTLQPGSGNIDPIDQIGTIPHADSTTVLSSLREKSAAKGSLPETGASVKILSLVGGSLACLGAIVAFRSRSNTSLNLEEK